MDSAKNELADKLKNANNILVTVSRNPSVDQLASCIGLTLYLNKLGKHAAAVFSGQVPSTIEFLQPEDTLEKNTDSLRDFIIALDKSKADKLRYKVEDNVVRIFITPYRTSISEADLDFSQGDFNVDVVVALGVQKQEDLDEAITAHGRILHDATVASVNVANSGDLGGINWQDPQASSLSELVTEVAQQIDQTLIDSQIATALLTGIVAETNRFSNDKTSSLTMSTSAVLMNAGANQQLVATKLEQTNNPPLSNGQTSAQPAETAPKSDDGTLEINHDTSNDSRYSNNENPSNESDKLPELNLPEVQPDIQNPSVEPTSSLINNTNRMITEKPTMGGMLTANTQPEGFGQNADPLTNGQNTDGKILEHAQISPPSDPLDNNPSTSDDSPKNNESPKSQSQVMTGFTPPPPAWVPPNQDPFNDGFEPPHDPDDQTLTDIEMSVNSPHLGLSNVDNARDEVNKALGDSIVSPEPIQALNAQPLGGELHIPEPTEAQNAQPSVSYPDFVPNQPSTPQINSEPTSVPPLNNQQNETPQVNDPNAPPPVPPPIPFQFRPPGQ